jgi:hypothetical protein
MKRQLIFPDFRARLRQFIERQTRTCAATPTSTSAASTGTFEDLALELFPLQYHQVDSYRRFCQARKKTPDNVAQWQEIPAIPTAAFKEYDLSSLPAGERTAVFHSSGTTGHRPSRHFHNRESLALYEASLLGWFQRHLLPEAAPAAEDESGVPPKKPDILILTPGPALASHSSLVHMFEIVRRQFGSADSHCAGIAISPDFTHVRSVSIG